MNIGIDRAYGEEMMAVTLWKSFKDGSTKIAKVICNSVVNSVAKGCLRVWEEERAYECLKCGRFHSQRDMIEKTTVSRYTNHSRLAIRCDCGFEWDFVHGVMSPHWDEIEWLGESGKWVGHQEGCLTILNEVEV